MTSDASLSRTVSVGGTLSEIVRLAPQKFDPNAVQALLIQVRRDAVGSNRIPLSKTAWLQTLRLRISTRWPRACSTK